MFDGLYAMQQIVDWITEFFSNNGSPQTKAIIGISGGKDSSVVAALCVRALGKSRVLGVLMPNGIQHDIDVAKDLCKTLDIPHIEINISEQVQAIYTNITQVGLAVNETAKINTPARVRMATLYAVSNIVGGMVADTGNLSESWVGYFTKFGDGAGDFAPLANLTSREVISVGKHLGLDVKFTDKTPIDGLSGKTDEENLGFTYKELDIYIRDGICENPKAKEKIDLLNKQSLHKRKPIPAPIF